MGYSKPALILNLEPNLTSYNTITKIPHKKILKCLTTLAVSFPLLSLLSRTTITATVAHFYPLSLASTSFCLLLPPLTPTTTTIIVAHLLSPLWLLLHVVATAAVFLDGVGFLIGTHFWDNFYQSWWGQVGCQVWQNPPWLDPLSSLVLRQRSGSCPCYI